MLGLSIFRSVEPQLMYSQVGPRFDYMAAAEGLASLTAG